MTYAHLDLAREGPVARITLDRPEALNALSLALEDDLRRAFRALSADDTIRTIVLTGRGRAFSVGVDLKELSENAGVFAGRAWSGPEALSTIIRACPHPVIAAINGFAVTGGLELALLADFLIASEDAKFADTHARLGITPAWGLSQILPRLIGLNRAKQMSLTGGFVDAATALDWGLVNEVVAPDALIPRAMALAAEIAETDAQTARKIRALIDDGARLPLDAALAREIEVFEDHIAGVTPETVAANRAAVQRRGKRLNKQDRTE